MPNYPNSTTPSTTTPPNSSSPKTSNKMFIAVIAVILIIAVIGFIVLSGSGGLGLPSATLNPTTNTTPIYLSIAQSQTLIGAPIINYTENYTATSLYNLSSPINISLLEYLMPQIQGNVTNGWVTLAYGSATNNASLQFAVLQTQNQSSISTAIADLEASSFQTLPTIENGMLNGMNYTYETYTNSTGNFQSLAGWKDGYVVWIDLFANQATTNQTVMAELASNSIQ